MHNECSTTMKCYIKMLSMSHMLTFYYSQKYQIESEKSNFDPIGLGSILSLHFTIEKKSHNSQSDTQQKNLPQFYRFILIHVIFRYTLV